MRLQGPEGKRGGAGEVMRIASLLFWLDRRYRWERFLLSIIEHIKECWWNSAGGRWVGVEGVGVCGRVKLKSRQLLSTSVCTTLSDRVSRWQHRQRQRETSRRDSRKRENKMRRKIAPRFRVLVQPSFNLCGSMTDATLSFWWM